VADANGARVEDCVYLFKESEKPSASLSGVLVKPPHH